MTAPVPTALPFGMRDCKIYPYNDAQGTILAEEGFDLPNSQTFSFADTEDFTDLRGDDQLVATHGNGASVKWTLEAGGIDLQCWAVFTGGQIIESGTAPNRVITLRKCSDDARPYFKVVGKIMSESGGDIDAVVYRAKCNGDISGQFGDGKFFVTSADGVGLPMLGTRLLYDIRQHETRQFLTLASETNPILPPKDIGITTLTDTAVSFVWGAITGYTGYTCQLSDDDGETWDKNPTADPTEAAADLTTLTANKDYLFRVAGKIGTDVGTYSDPVAFKTLPTTP
jgi:hypothetical protein